MQLFLFCIKPFVLFQPGFQLSYIAAFSLVLSSKLLLKRNLLIGTSFLMTLISQLSLYPILLFHFHELRFFISCELCLCSALFSRYFTSEYYFTCYVSILSRIIKYTVCYLCTVSGQLLARVQVGFLHFLINFGHRENQDAIGSVFAVLGVLCFLFVLKKGRTLCRCLPYMC